MKTYIFVDARRFVSSLQNSLNGHASLSPLKGGSGKLELAQLRKYLNGTRLYAFSSQDEPLPAPLSIATGNATFHEEFNFFTSPLAGASPGGQEVHYNNACRAFIKKLAKNNAFDRILIFSDSPQEWVDDELHSTGKTIFFAQWMTIADAIAAMAPKNCDYFLPFTLFDSKSLWSELFETEPPFLGASPSNPNIRFTPKSLGEANYICQSYPWHVCVQKIDVTYLRKHLSRQDHHETTAGITRHLSDELKAQNIFNSEMICGATPLVFPTDEQERQVSCQISGIPMKEIDACLSQS